MQRNQSRLSGDFFPVIKIGAETFETRQRLARIVYSSKESLSSRLKRKRREDEEESIDTYMYVELTARTSNSHDCRLLLLLLLYRTIWIPRANAITTARFSDTLGTCPENYTDNTRFSHNNYSQRSQQSLRKSLTIHSFRFDRGS